MPRAWAPWPRLRHLLDPEERPVVARLAVEPRVDLLLRDEEVGYLEVAAAGAAQAEAVPGVDEAGLVGGPDREQALRLAAGVQERRAVRGGDGRHPAQPGRVRGTARERPPAADPVAALDLDRVPGHPAEAHREDQPPAAAHPEALEPLGVEERQPDARLDERHPPDRRVDPREFLDHPQPLDRLGLKAPDLPREQRPEDAGVVERRRELRRDAPLVKGRRVRQDQRLKRAGDLDERAALAVSDLDRTRVGDGHRRSSAASALGGPCCVVRTALSNGPGGAPATMGS